MICLRNGLVYISKNLCAATKAALRENFITSNAYFRKVCMEIHITLRTLEK